jgi:predicted transcriptional regulator
MTISLRQSKVINNNMSNQQLNDNLGMADNMVKTYMKATNSQPDDMTQAIMDDMTKQLVMELTPSAPWELLPDMERKARLNYKKDQLEKKINSSDSDNSEE